MFLPSPENASLFHWQSDFDLWTHTQTRTSTSIKNKSEKNWANFFYLSKVVGRNLFFKWTFREIRCLDLNKYSKYIRLTIFSNWLIVSWGWINWIQQKMLHKVWFFHVTFYDPFYAQSFTIAKKESEILLFIRLEMIHQGFVTNLRYFFKQNLFTQKLAIFIKVFEQIINRSWIHLSGENLTFKAKNLKIVSYNLKCAFANHQISLYGWKMQS